MKEPRPIIIPLINPNEPDALLVELSVFPGQLVRAGDKLCILETTKSTVELTAEGGGYIVGLECESGQTVQAGTILAYLSESPDWLPPSFTIMPSGEAALPPSGLRISQPALLLAQEYNLDLTQLPGDTFITEKIVQELIGAATKPKVVLESQAYGPNSIIIYGGGGHGKALIDLLRVMGIYSIAGIVDDGIPAGTSIMGIPVLGGENILEHLYDCGIHLAANAVGGIGNITIRIKVFERLAQVGFSCPTLQHPTAFVESSASLAEGVQVMPHAYVGSETQVGFGVIINTGAIVSHDCTLGDYANLSPGSILAGEVTIGAATLVGMGVTVNLRVRVGDRARIGNGATVKSDVPEAGIVRAGSTWPADPA
jgi:acetyltransferase EpsM